MSGHQRVSIEQLHRADLQLFKFITRETKDGVRMKNDGTFPVEEAIRTGMDIPEVRVCLQPLQGGSCSKKRSDSPDRTVFKSDTVERPDKYQ